VFRSQSRGAQTKLSPVAPGAGITTYGFGSLPLNHRPEKSYGCIRISQRNKVLKSKKVTFKVPNKTVCVIKKELQRPQNRSYKSRSRNSDFRFHPSLVSLIHGSPASHHLCTPFAQLRANVQAISTGKGFPLHIYRTPHKRATEKTFPRIKRECNREQK